MRAFIAADIPIEVKQKLDEVSRIYRRYSFLKSVKPYNMHLTFAFLGEIPDQEAGLIANFLSQFSDTECIGDFFLKAFICFPDRVQPKVLVIGVGDSDGKAGVIHQKINVFLRIRGLEADEGREFIPHLTLARIGFPHPDGPRAIQSVEEKVHRLLDEKIIIRDLRPHLFQSILQPGSPPVYKKISS